jgi:hypothetical protein
LHDKISATGYMGNKEEGRRGGGEEKDVSKYHL